MNTSRSEQNSTPPPATVPCTSATHPPAFNYRTLLIVGWVLFFLAGFVAFLPVLGFFMAMLLLLVCVVLAIIILTRKGTAAGVILLVVSIVVGIPFSIFAATVGAAGAAVATVGGGIMAISKMGDPSSMPAEAAGMPKPETPQQIVENYADEYATVYARSRFMLEIWSRFKTNFTSAEAEKLITSVRDELNAKGYYYYYEHYVKNHVNTAWGKAYAPTEWATQLCGLHTEPGKDWTPQLVINSLKWNPAENPGAKDTMLDALIALVVAEGRRRTLQMPELPDLHTAGGCARFCEIWAERNKLAYEQYFKNGPGQSRLRVAGRAREYVNRYLSQRPVPPMSEVEEAVLRDIKDDAMVSVVLRMFPDIDIQQAVYAITRNKAQSASGGETTAPPAPAAPRKIAPASALPAPTPTEDSGKEPASSPSKVPKIAPSQ